MHGWSRLVGRSVSDAGNDPHRFAAAISSAFRSYDPGGEHVETAGGYRWVAYTGYASVRRCASMWCPCRDARSWRSALMSIGAITIRSPGPGDACASMRPSKSTTWLPPGHEYGG